MEPDGMVKACTPHCRITRARSTAMKIASAYSRTRDFRLTGATVSAGDGVSSGLVWVPLIVMLSS